MRQTFSDLVIHTPSKTFRWTLPWTFSTFDYSELCALLRRPGARRRVRHGQGRRAERIHACTQTAATSMPR
jgi:hypothetical protein